MMLSFEAQRGCQEAHLLPAFPYNFYAYTFAMNKGPAIRMVVLRSLMTTWSAGPAVSFCEFDERN